MFRPITTMLLNPGKFYLAFSRWPWSTKQKGKWIFALGFHIYYFQEDTFQADCSLSSGSHPQDVSLGRDSSHSVSESKVVVSVQLAILNQKLPSMEKVLGNCFRDFLRKYMYCLNNLLNLYICFVFGVCWSKNSSEESITLWKFESYYQYPLQIA